MNGLQDHVLNRFGSAVFGEDLADRARTWQSSLGTKTRTPVPFCSAWPPLEMLVATRRHDLAVGSQVPGPKLRASDDVDSFSQVQYW